MKKSGSVLLIAVVCGLLTSVCSGLAQNTAFMYQGQLSNNGSPADGSYDLVFTLFDSTNEPGNLLAGPVTNTAVVVSNGLFSTLVDFGNAYAGTSNWLEIAVSTNGAGTFSTLAPRQQLTPVPEALYANTASNVLGTVNASQLSGTFSGNGSGLTNVPGTVTQSIVAGTTITAQPNTAYDLTSASLVTVNFPVSANVGDVVLVNNTGSGGWQVGGQVWTESTTSGTTSQYWQSVASSASGSNLVAAIYGGGIWTSTNSGVTWTESTSSGTTSQDLASVASSASGSNLVAVVDGGGIWTSTNSGVTWTESTSSGTTSQSWWSVASSASGSNLVAVVSGGGIWTSTNSGVTWTESTSSGTTSQNWLSVASSASGSNLVAAIHGGGIWTSTNSGVTWTESTSSGTTGQDWHSVASSASGSNLVAVVSGGGIWTSANSGVTWTESTTSGTTSQYWQSVASSASGSNLVAVVSGGGIWTSTNSGVTWTESTSSGTTNQQWQSVASSASGSDLVAVVSGGGIWTFLGGFNGSAGSSQEFQYLGNGVWQPLTPSLGDNGQTLTNLNASQLTSGTVPLAQLPTAVVTNNESGVTLSGTFNGNGGGLTLLTATNLNGTVSQDNLGTTNFFTPTIGNGSANFTTSTQSGYYARVGNLVYFEDWVVWSSKGSVSSGNLVVSLPPIPIASNRAVFNIGYFNGINVSSQLAAFAGLGNTEITISTNSGSGMSVVPVSDCNAVGELQITGTYRWQ
ncbi:MAG TPA: hypothetical protein VGI03_04470 [Verrucomicrobiae bacterium]|jgi:hypothetical protein